MVKKRLFPSIGGGSSNRSSNDDDGSDSDDAWRIATHSGGNHHQHHPQQQWWSLPLLRSTRRRKLVAAALGCGVALLLLRVLVDVRVSVDVRWRLPQLQQAAAALGSTGPGGRPPPQRHCRNSCPTARDGVCDEGRLPRDPVKRAAVEARWEAQRAAERDAERRRRGSEQQPEQQQQPGEQRQPELPPGVMEVKCDLGTDCSDCGEWRGPQADAAWPTTPGGPLPVAFLRDVARMPLRARRADAGGNAGPFNATFAYTDPAVDLDVSRNFEREGVLEVGISQAFYALLSRRCAAGGSSSSGGSGSSSGGSSSGSSDQGGGGGGGDVVVDVGANFGWFSLLGAWLGCRVVAWEPVPAFAAVASYNLARNGLAHRVDLRRAVVADPPGSTRQLVVPSAGILGTAGIDGLNIDRAVEATHTTLRVASEGLDDVLLPLLRRRPGGGDDGAEASSSGSGGSGGGSGGGGGVVALMKIDVEGLETSVLATAPRLLRRGLVDTIVLEYMQGVHERAARWGDMWRHPQMLLDLAADNFTLMHAPDEFARVWWPSRALDAPLPRLRQITPANLRFDLWDAYAFRTGWLDAALARAPFCPEMTEAKLALQGVPERLHPKSFHSAFAHVTNVLATRLAREVAPLLDRPVGILPLSAPTSGHPNATWFPPRGSDEGLGATVCSDLAAEFSKKLGLGGAALPPPPASSPPPAASQTATAATTAAAVSAREVEEMMAVLIGRRCRCTHGLPCQRQAEIVERCTKEGRVPWGDAGVVDAVLSGSGGGGDWGLAAAGSDDASGGGHGGSKGGSDGGPAATEVR